MKLHLALEMFVGSCVVYAVVVACGQASPHVPEKVAAHAGEPGGGGEASSRGGRDSVGGEPSEGGLGGILDPVPDAGVGGADGPAGAPGDTAGIGGETAEPEPPIGDAGAGGSDCAPKSQSDACSGRACGVAQDGCGGEYHCGSCGALGLCEGGTCVLNPDCDCSRRECGVLGLCPEIRFCAAGQAVAEPEQSYCRNTTGGVCVADQDGGAACVVTGVDVCSGHHPDTCCATQPAGCRVGYTNCAGLHAVTRFGTICGSCAHGAQTHHCGTGEIR